MSNYLSVIYPEDSGNTYPEKFCKYISDRFFNAPTPDAKILDVGSGKGIQLYYFCKYINAKGYGIDLYPDENCIFETKICDFESEKLPYESDTFDFIFSKSVCEHVRNTSNFFDEIYRVLKPGGIFVCMTPDWISQMKNFYDDFTHVQPYTVKSLRNCMKVHNFDVKCAEYFYQLPFTWKYPFMKLLPFIISFLPDFFKWKTSDMSNTNDRKLIRFSKEKMILAVGVK